LSIYLATTSTYEPFHKRIRISLNVITQLGKIFWGWVVVLGNVPFQDYLVAAPGVARRRHRPTNIKQIAITSTMVMQILLYFQ